MLKNLNPAGASSFLVARKSLDPPNAVVPPKKPRLEFPIAEKDKQVLDLKIKVPEDDDAEDCEIVELEDMELLVEHIHFCEICGKGFRRDANLRMHMRAHGNQFKTPEAFVKPSSSEGTNTSSDSTIENL